MIDRDLLGAIRRRWQRWWQRSRLDLPLLGALLLVATVGLLVLFSASAEDPQQVLNQALRLGFGFAVLLVFSRLPPMWFRMLTPWFYLGTLGLLVLVLLLGEGRGANRWLDLKLLRFQPAELAKLALPMMVAWYLHTRALPPRWRDLWVSCLLIAVPALLIAKQPDLGTALLVSASGVFVVFLAGLAWRRILLLLGLGAASVPLFWHFMHEYQRNRVRMFLDPEADPLGNGWNIIQSKIAVGSGGLFGKGFMDSTQARLDFLPEHTTDFIFAVFSEEFGLLGVTALIAVYLFIIGRGLWIAANARDSWSRLLAGSLSMTFFVYVMVNGGMIAGLMPVVGVPMPLISYGGTSAVSLLAGFGLLMSIHSHRRLG
ncbi:MAG: rod shape-determining protein RodA [Lysobacterales bacterium CG02_land_8_20_14_3_00_62_12]|nr:MAG: rod shape-determining protein RodA [Xanthomonadales bacterium CG02_land_8_20_14_3_00_62_12]